MLVLPQRELLFWEDINANGWEEVVNRRKFAMVHHFLRHRVHKSLICQGGSTKRIPMPRRSVLMNRGTRSLTRSLSRRTRLSGVQQEQRLLQRAGRKGSTPSVKRAGRGGDATKDGLDASTLGEHAMSGVERVDEESGPGRGEEEEDVPSDCSTAGSQALSEEDERDGSS